MKKTLLTLMLLACLASSIPVLAQGDSPTLTATVIFASAFLREGPGTDYAQIGELAQDDAVTVIGRASDNAWFQIQLEDGTTAWIAGYVVSLSGDPATLPDTVPLKPEVIVPPGCDYFNIGPFFAKSQQNVILVQGWEAASPELVQEYLDNVIQIVSFDDRLISTYASYASDITADESRGTWQVFWRFDMGQVAAGEHHIEWTQMFGNDTVTDGLDADGDGQPDVYGPGTVTSGCTLIIE